MAVIAVVIVAIVWFLARRRADRGAPSVAEKDDAAAEAKGEEGDDKEKAPTSVPKTSIAPPPGQTVPLARIIYDDGVEEDEDDHTRVSESSGVFPVTKIVFDEDALADEPTAANPLFILSAAAVSDKGLRRKRNEDRVLSLERHGIFAVADGMGGYSGGEVASAAAVDAIREAFDVHQFEPAPAEMKVPRRAAELVQAISAANAVIFGRSRETPELRGMGTTISAARFSAHKQRLYVAHVGDSRVYRLRDGKLACMTTDHTMRELGVEGDEAGNLSRALGVWGRVPVDVVIAKPMTRDLYLLCSDGLTKMVPEARIAEILARPDSLDDIGKALVDAANAAGGKDNVSVVLVRVEPASKLAGGRTAVAR